MTTKEMIMYFTGLITGVVMDTVTEVIFRHFLG